MGFWFRLCEETHIDPQPDLNQDLSHWATVSSQKNILIGTGMQVVAMPFFLPSVGYNSSLNFVCSYDEFVMH